MSIGYVVWICSVIECGGSAKFAELPLCHPYDAEQEDASNKHGESAYIRS
jgi:hypothetical protein